jgi:hypothetical protein
MRLTRSLHTTPDGRLSSASRFTGLYPACVSSIVRRHSRMTIFEAGGLFVGIICGALVGAIFCSKHGTLAYVGGAVLGGFIGMIVGTLLGMLLGYACRGLYALFRAPRSDKTKTKHDDKIA